MRSDCLLALGLLAAAPAWATQRCGSRPDSCFKEAKACTRECASFMRATVTPCPVTTTVTTTRYSTKPAVTATVTRTIASTDTFSTLVIVSSTTTVEDSLTETATVTNPVTVTVPGTETVTIQPSSLPLKKRTAENVRPLPTLPAELVRLIDGVDKRNAPAPTCKPTTSRPSTVPHAASNCRSAAAFSSACSCAGVGPRTTTLPAQTKTVTTCVTSKVAPTVTVTATATSLVTVTDAHTSVDVSTFETTVTTQTVTDIVAATVVKTDVSTVVQTVLPTCTAYRFVEDSGTGPYSGQFVTGGRPDPRGTSYDYLTFTSIASLARAFTLRSNGRVYDAVNVYGWNSIEQDYFYVLQMTDQSHSVYEPAGFTYLTCSISPGGTSYPGAVGTLSCSFEGGPAIPAFGTCPGAGNNLFQLSGSSSAFCTAAILAAVPAGLTSC